MNLLKSKIFLRQFLAYLLIIFVFFSILSLLIMEITKQSIERQQKRYAEAYRQEVSESIKKWLDVKVSGIRTQALYLEKFGSDFIKSEEISNIIKEQLEYDKDFIEFIIIDQYGNIINSISGPREGVNLADRAYFSEAIKGKTYRSEFFRGRRMGSLLMAISQPVKLKNEDYVLAGFVSIERFKDMVEGLDFGHFGHGYMINAQKELLTASNLVTDYLFDIQLRNDQTFRIESIAVDQLLAGKSGTAEYKDFAGHRVYGSFEWLEDINAGLIVELRYNEVMRPIYELQGQMFLLAVAVIVLGIILAFVMSKRFVKPIRALIDATMNIAGQNYQEHITIKTGLELDVLVDQFNNMQDAIKNREQLLNKKNEELKLKRVEAEEANKLKSQFLANMSHELRTPLNSIIGFTTRVIKKSENQLPQYQIESLNIVKEEAQHLLVLINDLLDYSKIEAGKMDIHREEVALQDLAEEVDKMLHPLLDGKNVLFIKRYFSEKPIWIFSDRAKIKQILVNLISNAFKYSEKGKVELFIDRDESHYIIRVTDEGIGIKEKDLAHIFDEFRQVDGSYTRKVGGTGLGLSITKKLVDLLGGSIEAESQLGVGSCFRVKLPIKGRKD